MTTKKCTGPCGLDLPLEKYAKDSTKADGKRRQCRACDGARRSKTRRKVAPAPPAPPKTGEQILEETYAERRRREVEALGRRRVEVLTDENLRLRSRIAELVVMQKAPDIIVYDKPKAERADAIACVVGSDWHIEEPVEKASVHGLNEYNLEVAKDRSRHFFQNGLRLANIFARDSNIKTLYFAGLGDFFSGWIHPELMASTLLPPPVAAHTWMGYAAAGIDHWLAESDFTIEGDLIPGNHGRMTDKMHYSDPTGTSLETLAYHMLAARYAGNPRVKLNVASQPMVYRRFFEKFNMRLLHGWEAKYGGGVGGLTIPLNKAIAQWDVAVRADLTVLGHFHQFFDGGNFLVNGSLIGYNLFAQAIKARYEEAKQAFFLVHARGGGQKSVTAPIWLDSKRAPTL